jgi:beta-glucanase (GH16 family)
MDKDYYLSCEVMELDTLVWSDDFEDPLGNGLVNSSKWIYDNGPNPNNRELQHYTDRVDNSRVEDGTLKIVAKCDAYGNHQYTSARLVSRGLGEWGPGHRVEVRAKLPVGVGTWPAIWMLPSTNSSVPVGGWGAYGGWPHSGEIDIMESVGCDAGKIYGTVHTGAFNHLKNTQVGRNYHVDYGAWQTYTIDWEHSMIKWYTNGVHYHTFSPDTSSSAEWPFDKTFYLILNVAVGGTWGGYCLQGGSPSCTHEDHFRDHQIMEVDYVKVYTLKPRSARRLSSQGLIAALV